MRADDCPVVETADVLLAALERANDATVIFDGDLRVSYFNAAAERIWGLDRTEVLGCHVSRLGLGDLQPASSRANGDAAVPGSEIAIQRKDGSRIRAALSLSRVEIGGQSRTIAFVRDITAEVERRQRLDLLSLVADRTNRAVVLTDRNLRIVYSNAAFEGMFGYSLEEAQGRPAIELLAGPHTDRTKLVALRRCIGEDEGGEQEILAYDKGGEEVWISASLRPFRNKRGRIKYMFALLTDITETRQLRSLQQLIMTALADEMPITDIADRLCRRVEAIAPDVVCSLLHVDAGGLVHPLGGPSLPEDYCRALDGVAIGPDTGSCGIGGILRQADPGDGYRHRSALAAVQGPATRGWLARLLVDADQGQGRPRDRHLRLLFPGMPRAEPLASAHRRCLRQSWRARHRAQGSPRPDRAARLLRHADRPAEPRAFAGSDLRSDGGLFRRKPPGAGVSRRRQFQGRQRYARPLGRRRIAGPVCPAPAGADSARRHAGASGRRRVRDRAAEPATPPKPRWSPRGSPRHWSCRCGSAPGRCRCPRPWASASIPTTPSTSIR